MVAARVYIIPYIYKTPILLISIFISFHGVVHYEFLPPG